MGCCYSCEEDDRRESAYAPSRPRVPVELPSRSHPTYYVASRPAPTASSSRSNFKPYNNQHKTKPESLYGEYKCGCGHFWNSRLSWRDRFQQCKRCKAQVRPKNQRELRPTDFTRGENDVGLEHPQELCEMCKQVGGYCGKLNL